MRQFVGGICFLLLVGWLSKEQACFAQAVPKPAINDPLSKLDVDLLAEIDKATPKELQAMVARVEQTLSRRGQSLLQTQAQLLRLRDKAQAIHKEYTDSPAVKQVAERLKSETFKAELTELLKLPEKELPAKLAESLKRHGIDQRSLEQFREWRDASEAVETSNKFLTTIDTQLNSTKIPEISITLGSGGRGLLAQLKEIEQRFEGQPAATDDPADSAGSVGDVKALLQSLLGSNR